MLPGPAIDVCLGDEIKIRLYNNLHMFEGTSIHWHGLTQRGTPFMDGVSLVTQCPINAKSYFDYQLNIEFNKMTPRV
jgi:L-ascorbate oxidase